MVLKHLNICGYDVKIGIDNDREIDFVATKNNETVYVQVCYLLEKETTIEREFGNLLKIKDQYPKYVLSMTAFKNQNTYKGIIHQQIPDFLLQFE